MATLTKRPTRATPALLLSVLLAAPSVVSTVAEAPPPRVAAPVTHAASADGPAPRLRSLTTRVSPSQRRWVGEKIDVSLRDADLVEVLRSFAKIGRFNLVLDSAVKGRVTVELRDVPWDAALMVILRTHGLAAEIDGRIVSVSPLLSDSR